MVHIFPECSFYTPKKNSPPFTVITVITIYICFYRVISYFHFQTEVMHYILSRNVWQYNCFARVTCGYLSADLGQKYYACLIQNKKKEKK